MKPKELFYTAAMRGLPNRVPIVYLGFGASYCILKPLKLTWRDIYWDGKKIAKVMLKAYNLWKHDNVCTFLSTACGIDALGATVTIPEMEEPHVNYKHLLLKDRTDLEKLEIPDPLKDGSMAERIKATKLLNDKVGKEVAILGGFGGISTWAFLLRGADNFIKDSWLNQDFQREYMNFLTDCAIEFCVAQVDAGCQFIISCEDAFASDLLGPKLGWECNGVYVKRLADAIHKAGAGYILHCCGDLTVTLEKMADTGADVLSVDKIDLADAKNRIGNRVALMGNIKLPTLFRGNQKCIAEACKEAIKKAASDGGYLLSSGYTYPVKTPCENVKTLVETTRKYGTYPIKLR